MTTYYVVVRETGVRIDFSDYLKDGFGPLNKEELVNVINNFSKEEDHIPETIACLPDRRLLHELGTKPRFDIGWL